METYEDLVERMESRYEELSGFKPKYASDTEIRIHVLAGEIYSCMAALEWLKKQKDPHTAQGKELDELANAKGVFRREALKARGKLKFSIITPSWYQIEIPAGTVCGAQGEEGARYITLEPCVILQGKTSAEASAEAELPGEEGNAASGTIVSLLSAPSGVQGVTNPSAFTEGENEETDESLRRRLLQIIEFPPQGGSAAYYRAVALQNPRIRSVCIAPRLNGTGTLGIYADGRGEALTAAELEELRQKIEEKREVCVSVTVNAAERIRLPVKAKIRLETGWSLERASAACEKAIREFFRQMEVGRKFRTSALAAAMVSTGAVWEVNFDSAVTADREILQSQAAVCGEILLEEANP